MTREHDASIALTSANSDSERPARPLTFFFGTREQPCPYLPDRLESKVVTDLSGSHAQQLHDELTLAGFRRSHNLVYRPTCTGCSACVPVRIPVEQFKASRSQRRNLRINSDLHVEAVTAQATLEHYGLFDQYQQTRHQGGGMSTMSFDDYRAMVEETPVETRLVEVRDAAGELLAVSLSDWLGDGLSGIYKYFTPDQGHRSFGTFLILWHIQEAHRAGLLYVYLGYWIADCSKMSYKTRFQPLEKLTDDGWALMAPET